LIHGVFDIGADLVCSNFDAVNEAPNLIMVQRLFLKELVTLAKPLLLPLLFLLLLLLKFDVLLTET